MKEIANVMMTGTIDDESEVQLRQHQHNRHDQQQHPSTVPMNVEDTVIVDDDAIIMSMSPEEEQEVHLLSMDDAIDRIGMGRFQYGIMVAAGLCFASDAMEILLLSFLALVLQNEWQLTSAQTSDITASVFAGSFLGTLVLGRWGDMWGRKPVVLLTATMVSAFGIATAVIPTSYRLLLGCRFLVGVGIGGIGVVFDALAEFMPTHKRGQRLVVTSYFWTTATLMVPILAYFTLGGGGGGQQRQHSSWRLFVICCAVPCVISAIVTIYAVPESPRWLVAKQKDVHCALHILRKAAAINGKDADELFPVSVRLLQQSSSSLPNNNHDDDETIAHQGDTRTGTFWDLLSPELYRTTLLLWAVWGSYALLYYGTILAVTLVFYTSTTNDDDNNYHFDYLAMIIAASAEMAGVTLVLFSVDRFGRIVCQMTFFSVGGMLLLALCILKASHDENDNNTDHNARRFLVILAFLSRMFVYSGSSCVWITTAELLPTEIRTTSHSVANSVARIGAFLSPYLVSTSTPILNIGMFMMTISIVNVWCTWHLPETIGRPMGSLRMQGVGGRRRDGFQHVRSSEDTVGFS